MTSTTILSSKELQEVITPDEDLMFDRKGFDRRTLRDELAPTTTVDMGVKWVEQGQATYVHPDSDMPAGPTVEGETLGNIELVREVGGSVQLPRYTHGFTIEEEDREVAEMAGHLEDMRDGIMELFDLRADLAFFKGVEDNAGNEVFPGVLEWLDDNIPSDNVINCADFDLDDGDLQGIPANIINREAYSKITGEYVENRWDVAIANHETWALWNEVGRADYNQNRSQWQLINDDDAAVGVDRQFLMPEQIGLRAPSDMEENLRFELEFPSAQNGDDDDVMYLVPNHGGDFYELYENATAEVRDPIRKEGFKERVEYRWRAGVVYGFSHRTGGEATDAIKLENVSTLFD